MVGLLQCKLACRSSEGVSFLTGEGRKRQGGQVVVTYCTAPCVCVCVYIHVAVCLLQMIR